MRTRGVTSWIAAGLLACAAEAPVPEVGGARADSPPSLCQDNLFSRSIGNSGGTLEVPRGAVVRKPDGALASDGRVSLLSTASAQIREDFEATVPVAPAAIGGRAIVLLVGAQRPAAEIEVTVRIPENVQRVLSVSVAPAVWAQVWQGGGGEILDGFVRLDASLDGAGEMLTVLLTPRSFTRERRSDGRYEAILVVATAPVAH